jgi:hypothetical protein
LEAYRIDRFGSVDGIVLGSSEDPEYLTHLPGSQNTAAN